VSTHTTDERDLDVAGIIAAEVAAFNGDVVVEAGAEKPRLVVTLAGRATYKVERLGSLLYVAAKVRGLTYLGSAVSFHLWLPPGLALKLATVSGTIRVQGAVRTLDAKTATGAIEADGTGQGAVQARTANGAISLRGADGRIRASSANGEIAIAQAAGQIQAATSNGAIQIADAAGQIQAATSNGPIRLERVTLAPGSKSWARTGNGLVEVHGLSAPGGLRVRARVGRAPIQANLPGYEVRLDPYHLRAHLDGPHLGALELATGGQIVITA
jgi:DUF4097 and DUF4098 domain-containing protein YvlB